MRRIPRIVPWTNYQEYEQVYDWLYADIETVPELVEKGVERVNAWASRGKVPRAVESTAALLQVYLRDRHGIAHQWMSQQDLRLMYSMAIVRFVNGMVDPEQKRVYAKSVSEIAAQLGLPPWFVDLRHGATHEYLPSLSVLRSGCRQALSWLNESYWQVTLKPEGRLALDAKTTHTIKTLLDRYKDVRKQYVKKTKSHPKAGPDPSLQALNKLIENLSSDLIREGVIPILLNIGGIVPTGKKKRASLDDMSISEGLVQLWTPLIHELDVTFPGFGSDLIAAMVERIDISNDYVLDNNLIHPMPALAQPQQSTGDDPLKSPSYLLTITCWLIHFVNEYSDPSAGRILDTVMLDDILDLCLRKPNIYTRMVLQAIATVDEDGQSLKPFIRYIDHLLSNGKQASLSTDEVDMSSELKDLEAQTLHLKYRTNADATRESKTLASDGCAWQLHDIAAWSSCPIGCLPNGKVPCLDLTIGAIPEPMEEDEMQY